MLTLFVTPGNALSLSRGECTIKVDRVQKPERGGTTVRYRALVIGGNGNGAAGFGIGKALSPNEAIVKATLKQKGEKGTEQDDEGWDSVEEDFPHIKLDDLKDLQTQLAGMQI